MFKLFNILNPKWLIENFFTCYWLGGDSPSAPTNTTVTNTNVPEYAQPYVENMLNAAQAQIYNKEGTGFNPYVPYSQNPQDYVAGFSPLQQQAQSAAANMQLPGQFGQATAATQSALAGLGNLSYTPQTGGYQATSAPNLNNFTMNGPGNVTGATANAAQTGAAPTAQAAQLGNTPTAQAAQFQGPGDVSANNVNAQNLNMYQMAGINAVAAPGMQTTNMQAAQTGYNPQLSMYQMGPASQVGTQDFTRPGTAQQYMNPYLQASLDPQLAEIKRQYDITGQEQQGRATQAGAFGGSREALMNAENARNKNTAMNATISQGYNQAFQNAQQQFNAQQQANLQAQQANQQAGLTVGGQNLNAALGVQQLGTQTGMQTALANLSNQQQAAVNNQAAQLQASGMNAQQAMQAALANQTMGYNVGNTNLQAQLGVQQLGSGQNLQAQQLNQNAGLQAALANQQANLNTNQQNAQLRQQTGLANQALAGQYGLQQGQFNQAANLSNQQMAGQYGLQNTANQQATNLANQQAAQQANLANQQMGYNVGNTNLQSLLGVQQLGSGQNMQSQLANQSAAAQAQQLAAQQQQFGANYGLQGMQAYLSGANQLANLGTNQLNAQSNLLNMQNTFGNQQQQQQQQMINQAVQNYATAQQYPYMQLGALNAMTRGLPMQQASTQMYQAAPNAISQLAGLGTAAYGMSRPVRSGGLMEVQKMAGGGAAIPMSMMSNQQLQQAQKSPAQSAIGKIIAQGQLASNQYIANNPEAQKVFSQPLQPQPQGLPPQPGEADPNRVGIGSIATGDMTKMAGGGILAFADKGAVKSEWDDDSGIDPGVVRDQVRAENYKIPFDFGVLANRTNSWMDAGSAPAPAPAPAVNSLTPPLADNVMAPPAYAAAPIEGYDIPRKKDGTIDEVAFLSKIMGKDKVSEAVAEHLKDIKTEIAERKANMKNEAITRLGLGLMAAPNKTGHGFADFLSNLGTAGTGAMNYMSAEDDKNKSDLTKIADIEMNSAKADQARQLQLAQGIISSEGTAASKALALKQLQATQENTQAYHDEQNKRLAAQSFTAAVQKAYDGISRNVKNIGKTTDVLDAMAWNKVVATLSPYEAGLVGNPQLKPIPGKNVVASTTTQIPGNADQAPANNSPANKFLEEYNRRKAAQSQG